MKILRLLEAALLAGCVVTAVIYGAALIIFLFYRPDVARIILGTVALIATYSLLISLRRFVHEKIKKACGKSGHEWNGCKCRKCRAENHEWEYLQEMSFGAFRGGRVRQHNHLCKKCGTVMRSRKL